MPPEVCLGKPYDHKADVWAVGVILYEMIMLKKPFESDSINGVLSQITSCAYEPLSQDVDPNLKMLVVALLNKDFNKRPSIIEVANIPCVRKEILDFIEENDIQEEVLDIIDLIKTEGASSEDDEVRQDQVTNHGESSVAATKVASYQDANLEEVAEIIHSAINIQDYKSGWFGMHKNCCLGEEIYERVVDLLTTDPKKARNFCQTMQEQNII